MQITRMIEFDGDRVKGFGREVLNVPGCVQLKDWPPGGTPSRHRLASAWRRGKR
jgi:hypothetical protein